LQASEFHAGAGLTSNACATVTAVAERWMPERWLQERLPRY
jgi:hypothetical protein